jgi:hypothetical protein
VDVEPGSPSGDDLPDGGVIPVTQTAAPVQFGDLLTALQRDTRTDLQTFLREYSKGLSDGGADGFNQAIKYWKPAYLNSSLANDASLGQDPNRDVQRLLKGQQKTFAALVKDENALKGLVTNFNVTAAAFAREDVALAASCRRCATRSGSATRRSARSTPALPSLRAFAHDALPGVRSSDPTLAASHAVHHPGAPPDVRGRAARHRARSCARRSRTSVRFDQTSVPFLRETRALSACTNNVLVPFMNLEIPNPETGNEAENSARRSATSSSAACPASPARAASRTATTSTSTPARPRPATGSGPARRPTAAACRCRTARTSRARRRSCRTCTRPAARSRPSRSSTRLRVRS